MSITFGFAQNDNVSMKIMQDGEVIFNIGENGETEKPTISLKVSSEETSNIKVPLGDLKIIKIENASDIKIKNGESNYLILENQGDINKLNFNSGERILTLSYIDATLCLKEGAQIEGIDVRGFSDVKIKGALDSSVFAPKFTLNIGGGSDFHGNIKCSTAALFSSGSASIELDLICENLVSSLEGASDLNLTGYAKKAKIEVIGMSNLDGEDFKVQNLEISLTGSSSGSVNADTIALQTSGMSEFKPKNRDAFILSYTNTNPKMKYIEESINEYKKDADDYSSEWKNTIKKYSRTRKFSGHWMGLELGFNNYSTSPGELKIHFDNNDSYAPMELNFSKSLGFAWNVFQYSVEFTPNFGLVTGAGFLWNNYRFKDDRTRMKVVNNETIAVLDTSHTIFGEKSKLNVNWIRVPLLFEYNHGKSFHVSVGVIGSVKIGNSSVIKYYEQGLSGKQKDKSKKDIHINPLRADLVVYIGFNCINFYGKYSLTPMFANHRGPNLTPFEIGIGLNFY